MTTTKKRPSPKGSGNTKTILKAALKLLLIFGCIAFVFACIYTAACIASAPKIEPENIYDSIAQNSYVYDDEGNKIDTLCGSENRTIVKYGELPEDMVNAFVAIEDKTFWKHHGFNIKRMIGAVVSSVFTGNPVSGTSTITQQLARNVYLPAVKSERSIKRKITEMYYAYKIERALDKKTILEAYLNSIYLGYGCYGVSSAADTYFSKNVKNLSLEQCAALAALPQAPDSYALLKGESSEYTEKLSGGLYANDISKGRRELVLDLMAEQGYITSEEAEKAKSKSLKSILDPNTAPAEASASYSYFTDYLTDTVIKDLQEKANMSKEEAVYMVYSGGLKIYSTLDTDAQKVIADEFKNDYNFPYAAGNAKVEAAMVITENGTGRIKAMMGGRDPKGKRLYNRAISPRQPGSSIKPLTVYSAALQKSLELEDKGESYVYNEYGKEMGKYITTSSSVTDAPVRLNNGTYWPKNATRTYSGRNTFRTAIQQSINTCAVKILMQVDVDYAMEQLKKFGITTAVDDTSRSVNDLNLAALALGAMTSGCTPLEMSLAYGAFVNNGYVNKPVCYTKVVDSEGRVLLEESIQSSQAIDEGVAWIMRDTLQSVVSNGIARNAAISGVSVGGKTGTTDAYYDIWFDGFTPKYSAALWIGTDKNKSLSTMSGPAALLWSRIMRQIPGVTEGEYSDMPYSVIKKGSYYYTVGTEPESPVYFSSGKPKKKKAEKVKTENDSKKEEKEKEDPEKITTSDEAEKKATENLNSH